MFPFEAIAEVRLNGDGPYYIAQVRLPDSVVQPARHSYSTKEDRETDLQKEWRRIWNIK